MNRQLLLLMTLALLASGCGAATSEATPTSSATAEPSETSTLSLPPQPPTATSTPILYEGTLTLKLNVRSGPGTSYSQLGQLDAGFKVQILGRDSSGAWYQILYPSAPQGFGWVTTEYVSTAAGVIIPKLILPAISASTGRVTLRINVRSGPATTFDSLGLLEAGAIVSLTGKNVAASWFQVDYPSGPGGHGWVSAQYVQTSDSSRLPVLDDYGKILEAPASSNGTPAPTATSTVGPATADGDSPANPAARIIFSATGARQFTYSSAVSSPQGDEEDWVEFTPYAATGMDASLNFSLSCAGNGSLGVELYQGGKLLSGWGGISCAETVKSIPLAAGKVYQMRLFPVAGSGLQLVSYSLTIQNLP